MTYFEDEVLDWDNATRVKNWIRSANAPDDYDRMDRLWTRWLNQDASRYTGTNKSFSFKPKSTAMTPLKMANTILKLKPFKNDGDTEFWKKVHTLLKKKKFFQMEHNAPEPHTKLEYIADIRREIRFKKTRPAPHTERLPPQLHTGFPRDVARRIHEYV
jgi:hypothetical protein